MHASITHVAARCAPLALLVLCAVACGESAGGAGRDVARFGADGLLERPTGYRSWVHAGSPLTPNALNDGHAAFPEFHTVYVDPASYAHYRATGEWREGAMLVKELSSVGGTAASSGRGYFQGEFLGLEAAVKSAARFPGEPGNWAYFRFTDESGGPPHGRARVQPTGSCASCHAANAADDMVFSQYYPVLRAARAAGARAPEDT